MTKWSKTVAVLVAAVTLSGCGGGDSDTSSPAQGFWFGGSALGALLVTPEGEVWGLAQSSGVVKGAMTAKDGRFNGPVTVHYGPEQVQRMLSGQFTAKDKLWGSVLDDSDFDLAYHSNYDESPSLAAFAGNYYWTDAPNGNDEATLIVAADGTFATQNGGCTLTGQVRESGTGKHFFRVEFRFGSETACPAPEAEGEGVLFPPIGKGVYNFVMGGLVAGGAGQALHLLRFGG